MSELEGRRPLKVRSIGLAKVIAKWLSNKNISPNQISITSVVFAALASACLFTLPYVSGSLLWLLPLAAAVFIQCRLLCNLFDGMVAIEGGKGTASGEMFNDIPDRIADPLILIGAGYAVTAVSWGSTLGWLAALLAVMTAYVRTLAVSIGAPSNFSGPMAKQHRMALLTLACVLTAIEPWLGRLWPAISEMTANASSNASGSGWMLLTVLVIICIGCVFTIYNRSLSAYHFLENQ
ncbi:CDP-alcohol phosphatidyltransferase family protein [Psychrobacter lutiphocae]|uniref:CDP-alcohol phosphatidyltransferase family protein n=1 Tax=Psychrobacter lutiphocae TaxID=540500 RepID=UPI00038164AE|nr:CDP-alcohol phosphatidyltransferase family protein [Psychrobacter lutiphocae]